MTDREAYELLLRYSNEKTLIQEREMIRQIGAEETAKLILSMYEQELPEDFKTCVLQGLNYLSKMMSEPLN
jgi:hypothetical protein